MAYANLSALRTAIDAAPRTSIHKKPFTLTGINIAPGRFLWDYWGASGMPETGAVTTATTVGAVLDKSTTGAMFLPGTSAGSSYTLVDIQGSAYWQDNPNQSFGGTDFYIHFFDRVWQNSGIATNTTARQSWSPPSITRYVTGQGLSLWLRLTNSALSSNVNMTIEYVNQSGTSRTFTCSPRFSSEIFVWAPEMMCVPLQLGDTGIRSISAVTFSGTWTQNANLGFMIAKYLGSIRVGASSEPTGIVPLSFLQGMPAFDGNACLSVAIQAAGVYNATAISLTMPELAVEAKVLPL